MKKLLIIILFLVTITEMSFAEIYKWVDERGVVHFTDDFLQIPDKDRPKIEKMGLPEEKEGIISVDETTSRKKEEPYKDHLGRGEDYWKGRMEEWRNKLRDFQEKVTTLRMRYNELTEKYNSSKSTAERGALRLEREKVKNEMDQYKIQIEEAKNMIDKKIPEEAEIYKAKPEWLK